MIIIQKKKKKKRCMIKLCVQRRRKTIDVMVKSIMKTSYIQRNINFNRPSFILPFEDIFL